MPYQTCVSECRHRQAASICGCKYVCMSSAIQGCVHPSFDNFDHTVFICFLIFANDNILKLLSLLCRSG